MCMWPFAITQNCHTLKESLHRQALTISYQSQLFLFLIDSGTLLTFYLTVPSHQLVAHINNVKPEYGTSVHILEKLFQHTFHIHDKD